MNSEKEIYLGPHGPCMHLCRGCKHASKDWEQEPCNSCAAQMTNFEPKLESEPEPDSSEEKLDQILTLLKKHFEGPEKNCSTCKRFTWAYTPDFCGKCSGFDKWSPRDEGC
jgi:hypothetical protein